MATLKEQMEALWRGDGPRSPIGILLGFELVEYELNRSFFTMLTDEKHMSVLGTVQGGVINAIAEAAIGVAFATTLNEQENFTITEIHTHYLKPMLIGRIDAHARVVDRGRTLGLVECELFNEKKQLIAKVSSTCMVRKMKPQK